MKTLVGIQGHAGMQESINVNCEFWKNSNCDLIGLEGLDSPVEWWPDFVSLRCKNPIRPGKSLGYGLKPTLSVDSIESLTKLANACHFDALLWTECDSIFLGPVPDEFDRSALNAVIAGYCPPEWKGGDGPFLHPPFLMTVEIATKWCDASKEVSTEEGNGAPDVFVPIVCKAANIGIVQISGVYSCNGLDMRLLSKLNEARESARMGCWHIHGIKRKDHQDYILGKTNAFSADTIL
jgi:hypothetical protein